MRAGDQFLEWAEFSGNLYGTSQVDTERILATGDDVVLVIDVQGAPAGAPPRLAGRVRVRAARRRSRSWRRRLRERKGDTEEQIQRRLALAREEVAALPEYDYVIVNDTVDACVERLQAIVLADRARRSGDTAGAHARAIALADQARREAMASVIAPIVASFARARSLRRRKRGGAWRESRLASAAASAPTRRWKWREACRSAATTCPPS